MTLEQTTNKLAWLVNNRKEITVGFNILSQITEKNYIRKHKNHKLYHQTRDFHPGQWLKYKKTELRIATNKGSLRKFLSGGSFSGIDEGSSQVGYMIFIINK